MDIAERRLLNQSNYRWIESSTTDEGGNSDIGKKEKKFSYYTGYNWDDVENLQKKLLKHKVLKVVVG